MCYLPKRFFCHSLRTGGYAVGWLGVLGSIGALLDGYAGVVIGTRGGAELVTYIVMLIASAITITADGMLIYGTKEGKRYYILPWLVWHGLLLVVFGAGALLLIIVTTISRGEGTDPWYRSAGRVAIGILWALFIIGIYLWQCILALYKEIVNGGPYPTQNVAMTSVNRMDQEAGRPLYPSPYVNKQ